MKRCIIRVDGTVEELPNPMTMTQIREAIGAETLDTVNLRHLGWPLWVMCVDDHGYETELVDHGGGHFEHKPIKARKPVNVRATELYHANCQPGTTHQIVGDVVVVLDEDFS